MFSFPRVNGEQNMVGYSNFYFLPKRFVTAIPQAKGKAITANLSQAIPFYGGYSVFGNLQFKDDPERTPAGVKYPVEIIGSAPVDKPEYLSLFEEMVEDEFVVLIADLNGRIKICGSLDKGLRFIYKTEGTGYTFKFYGQYDAAPPFYFGSFTVDSTIFPSQTYNPPVINPGAGGVTGLQPEQILFGSNIGTIDQSPLLYWQANQLTVNAPSFQQRINITAIGGNGYINFANQSANAPANSSGTRAFANNFGFFSFINQNSHAVSFSTINHTAPRTYLWQDRAGTVALLDDIPPAVSYANTNTIELSLSGPPHTLTANVRMQHSITTDANGIRLVNDQASPGAHRVYGTDAIGNKVWRALSLIHFEESTGVHLSQQWNRWNAVGTPNNLNLILSPKGDGSLMLQVPDGTALGGNQRGLRAVDLQRVRTSADQVPSGVDSFTCTANSLASGARAFAACQGRATGSDSASFSGLSSGLRSFTANSFNNRATATNSAAFCDNNWSNHESAFGIGVLGRSAFIGSFFMGGGVPSPNRTLHIASYFINNVDVVPTDVINFSPISGTGLTLPSGSSHRSFFVEVDISSILFGSSTIWNLKLMLSIYNTYLKHTQVIYQYKDAGYNNSTITASIVSGELRLTFTSDYTGKANFQCYAKFIGAI